MKLFIAATTLATLLSIACSPAKLAASQSAPSNSPTLVASQPPANDAAQNTEQSPCTLTIAGAPDFNGLKLRMAPDEVLALFPGSNADPEVQKYLTRPPSPLGVGELLIRPDKYESKEKFQGISRITFNLLDGRVSTFTLNYNGPEFSHVDKFMEKMLGGSNLPAPDQWEAVSGMESQLKTLKCSDFEIRAFAGGQGSGNLNYVLLQDLEADKKLKDRRRKAREQATPSPSQ